MCPNEDGGVVHIMGGCYDVGDGDNELQQGLAGAYPCQATLVDVFTVMRCSAPRGQHQNCLVLLSHPSAQSLHGAAHTRTRCIDAEFLAVCGPPSANGK